VQRTSQPLKSSTQQIHCCDATDAPSATVEPKLQAFYDSLDVKQKKAFDTGERVGGILDWWRNK